MRALVSGASGFIGGALTGRLLDEGWDVVALGRRPGSTPSGTTFVRWELSEPVPRHALESVDVVFHVAARVGDWGRRRDYERENVQATARLVEACEAAGVKAFVLTSSPSALMSDRDVEGEDESMPAPSRALSEYSRSKARAEIVVRSHCGAMKTIALRPHAVVGPGERHLGRLVDAMAAIGAVVVIGDQDVSISMTSIDTCVCAHLRAAQHLLDGGPSGAAYFVADEPALSLTQVLVTEVERKLGRPPRVIRLSRPVAMGLATLAEWVHAPFPFWAPIINRYRVVMLSRAHWFSVERMKRDLGVVPKDARTFFPGAGEGTRPAQAPVAPRTELSVS